MAENKCVAVILAGGSGTRFWPLSSSNHPKQYLQLFGKRSLIQHTFDRARKVSGTQDIFVCSNQSQKAQVKEQLPECAGLILEPSAQNTGPAVLLSVLELLARGYSEKDVLIVFPSDHYITDTAAFERLLRQAIGVAVQTHGLVTMGIVPHSPHTGYGYIETGNAISDGAFAATRFVEKPDARRAEDFVHSGKFFWNSGIFVWTLGAIWKAFQHFAPKDTELLSQAHQQGSLAQAYQKITALPVDKMILEKAANVFVVPAEMGWSDVGSWNSLFELKEKDAAGNAVESGKAALLDSQNCLVHAENKTVSLIGVKDLVVVVEGDSILVCDRSHDQKVREAAKLLDPP